MRYLSFAFLALFFLGGCEHTSDIPTSFTIKERWWTALQDPLIDELAQDLFKQNIDIQIAQARLKEAEGVMIATQSSWFPHLSASGSASRSNNQIGIKKPISITKGGLNASWDLDFFGQTRAEVEAAENRLEAQMASVEDARNRILAELVRAVIEWRRAQQLIKETKELLVSQDEQVKLLDSRVNGGLMDATFLERAKAQRAQTSTELPAAHAAALSAQYQIEHLLGKEAGSMSSFLQGQKAFSLSVPRAEPSLEISLKTIKNRPDVRAARFEMLAVQADLEKAEAALWPQISLGGFYGAQNVTKGVPVAPNPIWSLTSSVTAPLLNFGLLQGAIEIADARAQQACLSYKDNVLKALQEVRTALSNYLNGIEAVMLQEKALKHRQDTVELAQERFKRGLTDMTDLTTAQTELDQATITLINRKAETVFAYIQFQKALGRAVS